MRKSFLVLPVLLIIILLFSLVFANNMAANKRASNTDDNFHNTILVSLNIDYGRPNTQNNYVTLKLDVGGQDVDINNLKVQFSLDNKNWLGFNSLAQRWEHNFISDYQPFYPSFYIGSTSGLKTVYAKVTDSRGNVGLASAKINYSADTENPYVVNPQSLELNNFQGPLVEAGVKRGSGSVYDPYIIANNKTRLLAKMPNVTKLSYYMEEGKWSQWYDVEDQQANLPIEFSKVEGLKEVRIRSKNKYGVEADPEIIYYLLDYTKPTINLHTDYHSFIAINGSLEFDLEVNDNLSNSFDFEVEVFADGNSIVKKGRLEKYDEDKSTITTLTLDGLPEGKLNVRVTVIDEAGNTSSKQISVNSIS